MRVLEGDGTWGGVGWAIEVGDGEAAVTIGDTTDTYVGSEAGRLGIERSWWRHHLTVDGERVGRLRGLTTARAARLRRALGRIAIRPEIVAALAWQVGAEERIAAAVRAQRWITTETVDDLVRARPAQGLAERIRGLGGDVDLTEAEQLAVGTVDRGLDEAVAQVNEQIVEAELRDHRAFFDTIEKSPLTDEQARAVICFDNRVQVLAAAGSGKTSVMVARAAYAVMRGFVRPERVLLLAFNTAAAAELQERIEARFAAAGIDSTGIRASTFHAYGLTVIGEATGRKPRPAPWLSNGGDARMMMQIVDELRAASEGFRYRWDLYRLLFGAAPSDLTDGEPDSHDKKTDVTGFETYAGETVHSNGEKLIANFLYLNGINYRYEAPYRVDVATPTHSQYRPDFHYPDIDVWHEHWALDRDGNPPAEFHGYAESMQWKRQLHAQHGTTLIESTWFDVMYGDGLQRLKDELTTHGLVFDWNPDRPIKSRWAKTLKHEDLARLLRTFQQHVKSNSWTREQLVERLRGDQAHLAGYRTQLFLDIFWEVHDAWQQRLADDGYVDFDDMLVDAADHLEAGDTTGPYDLIMVDEFQDASQARARLTRGLLNRPGQHLLAVGDDWQSINRFAGADLSVMTDFHRWFGRGPQLALTTTFRCPQSICDVATGFVTKNPDQFDKAMNSARADPGPAIDLLLADAPAKALATHLEALSRTVAAEGRSISVDVLGRYRFQRDDVPKRSYPGLWVTFRTIHGSKGLEADHIVVLGLDTGTYGFPSTIEDDAVLRLAMPSPETFRHAEERRLLYVALTRARHRVTLLASPARMSPFAVELLEHELVRTVGVDGTPVVPCPRCNRGTLRQRKGRYGAFLGCQRYPACTYTSSLS